MKKYLLDYGSQELPPQPAIARVMKEDTVRFYVYEDLKDAYTTKVH